MSREWFMHDDPRPVRDVVRFDGRMYYSHPRIVYTVADDAALHCRDDAEAERLIASGTAWRPTC